MIGIGNRSNVCLINVAVNLEIFLQQKSNYLQQQIFELAKTWEIVIMPQRIKIYEQKYYLYLLLDQVYPG